MQSVFCLGKSLLILVMKIIEQEKKQEEKSRMSAFVGILVVLSANEEVSSQKAMWIAFSKVCVRYVWDQRPGEESRRKCMFSSPVRWTASSSTKDRNSRRFSIHERKYLHLKEKGDYVYFLKRSSFMIMRLLSFVVVVELLSRVWLFATP